jgi:hypothetical protein
MSRVTHYFWVIIHKHVVVNSIVRELIGHPQHLFDTYEPYLTKFLPMNHFQMKVSTYQSDTR